MRSCGFFGGAKLEPPLSAKEILREYWQWIGKLGKTTGKLRTAVGYALNQKQYLETFLEHGEIEISNNQVENAIRPFVVGRKGWLFSDTVNGAYASRENLASRLSPFWANGKIPQVDFGHFGKTEKFRKALTQYRRCHRLAEMLEIDSRL